MTKVKALLRFNGLGMTQGNLSRLSDAETRSISPENFGGAMGRGGMATKGTGAEPARELGQGWKVSPSVEIAAGEVFTLADIDGAGAIQHIWCTVNDRPWRDLILRIHWDGQDHPSVECPLGDFFACGWGSFAQVSSSMVAVNPGRGFNSYWEMPFRKRARITLENRNAETVICYGLGCTAGMCRTRSGSGKTSRSPFRRWAGGRARHAGTCRCAMILPRSRTGIRRCPLRRFRRCKAGMSYR